MVYRQVHGSCNKIKHANNTKDQYGTIGLSGPKPSYYLFLYDP